MKSCLVCLFLALVGFAPRALAQFDSRETASLQGEVENNNGSGLVVALSASTGPDYRTDVSPLGDFEFRDVPYGEYQIAVTTLGGDVIQRQFVALRSATNRVTVRLPEDKAERPSSGTVSAKGLQHRIPSKARKEFEKGVEAARKNDSASAIGHLAKAVELDPDFAEAHNDLGAQHLKAEANETALAEFQKASELDPGLLAPHLNEALTLLRMRRYPEAESNARQALHLNAGSAAARYYLGLALAQQNKNTSEALDNLQRACDSIPRARLVVADILEKQGDPERAKKELLAYLNSGPSEDRQSVEIWLASLR